MFKHTNWREDLLYLTCRSHTCYLSEAVSTITAEVMPKSLANISAWQIAVLACGVLLSQLEEMCMTRVAIDGTAETIPAETRDTCFFFLTKDTQG